MQLKEKLEELIRLFHEGEVVERIVTAENHFEEYEKQKEIYREQLEEFTKVAEGETIDIEYEVLPENALRIYIILMMSRVEDCDIFEDLNGLTEALSEIKEEKLRESAEKIENFTVGILQFFSDYKEEELVDMFFSN